MTFLSCLHKGMKYELESLKYFPKTKSYVQSDPSVCFKDYDLLITMEDDTQLKVEVKADFMGSRTGNVAVEWECNGQPSGISSTKADVWVFFVVYPGCMDDCYIIPTSKLLEISKNCRTVSGGDGNRSRMLLLPTNRLANFLRKRN